MSTLTPEQMAALPDWAREAINGTDSRAFMQGRNALQRLTNELAVNGDDDYGMTKDLIDVVEVLVPRLLSSLADALLALAEKEKALAEAQTILRGKTFCACEANAGELVSLREQLADARRDSERLAAIEDLARNGLQAIPLEDVEWVIGIVRRQEQELADRQRLFDLVRHQRHALYEAELISDDEFSQILTEGSGPNGSVARLESYDSLRSRLDEERAHLKEMISTLAEALMPKSPKELREAEFLFDAEGARQIIVRTRTQRDAALEQVKRLREAIQSELLADGHMEGCNIRRPRANTACDCAASALIDAARQEAGDAL